ncbi:MAG: diphthine--ammonia ligase [Candidatus Binatia bacterium]
MSEPVVLAWSGGKDSCLALDEVRRGGEHEVTALLATIIEGEDRVQMHGVPRALISRQAEALGVPLDEVWMPPRPTNEQYEARLGTALAKYHRRGVRQVAFGDLFIEEIRAYRETALAKLGMRGLYPLWQRDTGSLARRFVDAGFRAVVVCVDSRALPRSFAGRVMDREFLTDLPPGVDRSGENGEFHTFVFDGPGFAKPVDFVRGAVRDDPPFVFCDLLPT